METGGSVCNSRMGREIASLEMIQSLKESYLYW
jgi:hypothetical protein